MMGAPRWARPNLETPPGGYKERRLPPLAVPLYIGSVLDRLLILWLVVLGVGRVDFLGGSGPFVLTPFLVLSPILLAGETWRAASEGWRYRVSPSSIQYLVWVSALLALILTSTFLSYDLPTSGRRFALLLVQVYLVFFIGLALANRPDPARLLLKGAYAGLALCVLFSAAQMLVWLTGPPGSETLTNVVDLEARSYFGVVPRLTGASHDANFGGFLILFYLFLILLLGIPSRVRTAAVAIGVLLVAMTLSRSALLAGLALWALMALRARDLRITPRAPAVLSAVLGVVTVVFLLSPMTLAPVVDLGEILGNRFTLEEGSTSEHATVFARGWEVGTESVKNALLGIGYGTAHFMLQDIFPGNDYGNFHSFFVTLFAEAGVPAALLGIWIFAAALVRAGPYRPLVAALIAYNLFQQAHTEPTFWFILLLAWVGIGTSRVPAGRDLGTRTNRPRSMAHEST
jgi:hypothetical protein